MEEFDFRKYFVEINNELNPSAEQVEIINESFADYIKSGSNDARWDNLIQRINAVFDDFYDKLMSKFESESQRIELEELRNPVYEFYLYILSPELEGMRKCNLESNATFSEIESKIEKLLSKFFFLTSFTYEILTNNVSKVSEYFNKKRGKTISDSRLSAYISVTRKILIEELSERNTIKKLAKELGLYDNQFNHLDFVEYEKFVRAYNKWKNDNSDIMSKIYDLIRTDYSNQQILDELRTEKEVKFLI